jgi:hypothetical protein
MAPFHHNSPAIFADLPNRIPSKKCQFRVLYYLKAVALLWKNCYLLPIVMRLLVLLLA